ncbi:MAG: molybdopterin-dependent oxidoreductase [Halanaeroarchaeum sp.]
MGDPVGPERRTRDGRVVVAAADRTITVGPESDGSLPETDDQIEIVCASGNRYEATWTGIPVSSLLEAVGAPADTTHLTIASADGYRIAVPLTDGLDGMIAYRRDGRPIGDGRPYRNRFVAPAVEGARDVKGVVRVEFHSLGPTDDPDALEVVEPMDDRFAADR